MDKSSSLILCLHSALGTQEDVKPLIEILQEKGLKAASFNFSGHGTATVWPDQFRIDLFARDLENYLQQHQIKDVTIFGHSMGGYVALYHKLNFENSPIKQIFTYGTKFNWSESAVAKELQLLDPVHLQEKFPHLSDALKSKHGDRWKQLLLSTAHMMQNLERLDGLTREDLNDIDIPVTLMLGDQDRMVTSEETHLTATWLHQNQVKIVSHSKHELDRTNLRELANIIIDGLL